MHSWPWVTCATLALASQVTASNDFNKYFRKQQERLAAFSGQSQPAVAEFSSENLRYASKNTPPFLVKSLPDVTFDTGELYAGSIPINKTDPSRTLFFVYKPAENSTSNDITIWLNGGPGCSSLAGFLLENGPVLWQAGTFGPRPNPFSWSKYTNMLWVEQPVGTGFAQGEIRAKNELDVARDFVGFFKNWEDMFGIKNHKIYVTGESYAGRYVPYIAEQMLKKKDKTHFDISGALAYTVQFEFFTYPYAAANEILNLNDTLMSSLQSRHQTCGYADYIEKYLSFPPPGLQPPQTVSQCDLFEDFYDAAFNVNPCFNVYHITDFCPMVSDAVLGPYTPLETTNYFNRTDVKKAIHAPLNVSWSLCAPHEVFLGPGHQGPEFENDRSPDPIQGVLPKVIEATNGVLIGHGDWDALLIANGTLISIQTMTWNGKQGFQRYEPAPLIVDQGFSATQPAAQGQVGTLYYERGLMWTTTAGSGHQQPWYQPRATLKHLQWLLGQIDTL